MNQRMDRSKLNIGAYYLQPYARTEQHVRDAADCGIEFFCSMSYDTAVLDLFHKYGIGAIVNGVLPGWWGGDGERAGQMESTNPMHLYKEAADGFKDHPAIWGIDVGDEPSALDFPYYGRVINNVLQWFPNQFAYLNLYPNYASVAENNAVETVNQLGTATYEEHIERYCQCVGMDYICYDFYLYSAGLPKHYENLRVISDAAQRTGRDMWIVLQVNSSDPSYWITENNLRFQAYTAMAYGAQNIIWGCYTAGWWHNQVLDDQGEKTEQYEKLKKVNAEIRVLRDEYMKYRRVSTHYVGYGEGHLDLIELKQKPVDALSTGVFMDVHADQDAPLVIGQMVSRKQDGSQALFICAADDPMDTDPKEYHVEFKADVKYIKAMNGRGPVPVTRQEDGTYRIPIRSNDGLFVTAR